MEYLDCYEKGADPAQRLRKSNFTAVANGDLNLSEAEARLRAICFSLSNLIKPIKLISFCTVKRMGRFPRYDEEFDFVELTHENVNTCVAISHRWTDVENSRSDRDVSWLKENWEKIDKDGENPDPLFFYDFSSLPQRAGRESLDPDETLTFRAGLELIDHMFSCRAVVIPTKGYLFRYWCYVEFFIIEYNESNLSGVPFIDPVPGDLKILDTALDAIRKAIVRPSASELQLLVLLTAAKVSTLVTLGSETMKNFCACIMGLTTMDNPTRQAVLREFVHERDKLADMIRSRLRQCSITREEDKPYLQNLLARYLERKPPVESGLTGSYEYTEWDNDAALTRFTESLANPFNGLTLAAAAEREESDEDSE